MKRNRSWLLGFCWVGLLLSRCTVGAPLPSATPTILVSSLPTPTLTPTPQPIIMEPDLLTLTLWVPDVLNPLAETGGASLLLTQLNAFTQANPGVQVQVLVKKAEGPGGIYHLLSTATAAAPTVLPDLVILGEGDLLSAVRNQFVQPLPSTAALQETDFFPFAWSGSQIEGQNYGFPYLAQTAQTVYRAQRQATPPLAWNDVLTGSYSFLFPAAPPGGLADDTLLAIYFSSGGAVVDENGAPVLDRVHLEELYRFFAAALEAGVLDAEQVAALTNAEDCWSAYQEGKGNLSVLPAGAYWATLPRNSQAAWLPTPDGKPAAVAHLWTLALVTHNPARQAAALTLASWLTTPERAAALANATGLLPAQRQALTYWSLAPEDAHLLETLLTVAQLPPPSEVGQPVRRALQAGLTALLQSQVATPEEAATQALTVLRR